MHIRRTTSTTLAAAIVTIAALSASAIAAPSEIIATNAVLRQTATGFEFTEGPAMDSSGNVYFTDQPNDRILKWTADGKITTFLSPCGRSNGLCFDHHGNIIACADEHNQLWSIDAAGKVTALVKDFEGKLLDGPNDVWVRPDGGMYFTDPYYWRSYWNRGPEEQPTQGVYYRNPNGALIRVVSDMRKPNGIIGTPDGETLYVSDIDAGQTFAYDIQRNGALTNKRLFCSLGSDGMTIDNRGDIYLTGNGVTVFDKTGRQIDHIDVPESWTGNVCFAGRDRRTLFITASHSIYTLRMKVHGVGSQ